MDRIESSNFFKTNKFGLLQHIQLVHLLSLPAMSIYIYTQFLNTFKHRLIGLQESQA